MTIRLKESGCCCSLAITLDPHSNRRRGNGDTRIEVMDNVNNNKKHQEDIYAFLLRMLNEARRYIT